MAKQANLTNIETQCPNCRLSLPIATRPEDCPKCLLSFALTSSHTTQRLPNPGDHIGPYQIHQVIGQGGMGTVFRAIGPPPLKRELALKVITSCVTSPSSDIVLRFEAERQALSLMNHPSIAKIYDANNSPDGTPYFAMELCHGKAVTLLVSEHNLPINTRLHVFLEICEAIQHAHQNGIIHRDLKPSNILASLNNSEHNSVTVKIIDFGIAKALDQKLTDLTLLTSSGHFLGTPAYASPEQLLAKPTDTRSDIYALGCILYELLTNTPPYPPNAIASTPLPDLHKLLTERDPEIPSKRLPSADIPQDLDWITMRAVEKNPDHRYTTVAAFADDIRRHLDDLPVHASPPSLTYRIKKFTRRHRLPMATAAAILIALIGGIITTTVQASRAKRSESKMAEQKSRADELVNFMLNNHFKRLDRPGDQAIKVETARAVLADLKSLPEKNLSPANQRTLGNAYWEAGIVLQAAGEWNDAHDALAKGASLWGKLSTSEPNDLDAHYNLGLHTNGRGWFEEKLNRPQNALQSYQNAVQILEDLNHIAGENAKDVWKLKLRTAYRNYSRLLIHSDPTLAEAIARKGLALISAMRKNAPDDLNLLQAETDSLTCIIPILISNDPSAAVASAIEVVERKRTQAKIRNQHPDHQTGVAVGLSYLSDAQAAAGDIPAAIKSRQEMAEIYRSYNREFPEQVNIPELLANQLTRLAEYHYIQKQTPECIATLEEAEKILTNLITRLDQKAPQTWRETLTEVQNQLAKLAK